MLGVFALGLRFANASTVWIDTDVSIGSPVREVDDAFALVLALHSPEIRIAGVSATYGNAPLGHTRKVAAEMIRRFGPPAGLGERDVHVGAGSASDLGRRTAATEALRNALGKRRLTYIALGPLTNLATFLQLHPELAGRFDRVIFLGGQLPGTQIGVGPNGSFSIHDANVFKDPAATAVVLRSRIPLTVIPIPIASKLLFEAADLRTLQKSGEPGNYLASRSRIWLWFWTTVVKENGGAIFDALVIVAAVKPELLTTERRNAMLDEKGNLLVTEPRAKTGRTIEYCRSFAPGTKRFVLNRIGTRRSRD